MGDVVAREIRRHREDQKLTLKQLATECAKLGASQLTVSALTNIERGQGESGPGKPGRQRGAESVVRRRRDVSHDELLVIAAALRVAPIALLFPLQSNDLVEVLPGHAVSAWRAAQWFAGFNLPPRLDSDLEDVAAWQRGLLPLTMRRDHDRMVDGWAVMMAEAANNREMAKGAISVEARSTFERKADQMRREARALEYKLAEHRRFMRRHGVSPDEQLPDGLEHVDRLSKLEPVPLPVPREDDYAFFAAMLAQKIADDRAAIEAATDDDTRAVLRERLAVDEARLREVDVMRTRLGVQSDDDRE